MTNSFVILDSQPLTSTPGILCTGNYGFRRYHNLPQTRSILGFPHKHGLTSPFPKVPAEHFMQGDSAQVVDLTMFVSNVAQSTPQTSAPPPNNIVPLSPRKDQLLRILHSNPATTVMVDRLDFLLPDTPSGARYICTISIYKRVTPSQLSQQRGRLDLADFLPMMH